MFHAASGELGGSFFSCDGTIKLGAEVTIVLTRVAGDPAHGQLLADGLHELAEP